MCVSTNTHTRMNARHSRCVHLIDSYLYSDRSNVCSLIDTNTVHTLVTGHFKMTVTNEERGKEREETNREFSLSLCLGGPQATYMHIARSLRSCSSVGRDCRRRENINLV